MKKLILSMFALMAMSTTSFAQQFAIYQPCPSVSYSVPKVTYSVPDVTYSLPSISYNVPDVTYSVPSTNTTIVCGYTRDNGTFVQPYVRTMPNETNWDNFSTKGNSNPFTGSTGYKARDYSSDALNYGAGHTIYSGSRGGQYYYNSRGHKTYVPKRSLW